MNDTTDKPLNLGDDIAARQHQPSNIRKILAAATESAAQSDLGRWMASGARLLETARARLLRAEHDYTTGRARIIADAQHRLAELQTKTREELHSFDAEHERQINELRDEVVRLETMREAGDWPVAH